MYIYSTDYKFKHIYDLKTLMDYSNSASRDIERLEEAIEKCKEYQMEIYNHVQNVINTEFKKIVVIDRCQDYSSKKITYYIYLDNRPMIEEKQIGGNFVRGTHSDQKSFKGKERHLAKEYALKLAKEHNAVIEQKKCNLI